MTSISIAHILRPLAGVLHNVQYVWVEGAYREFVRDESAPALWEHEMTSVPHSLHHSFRFLTQIRCLSTPSFPSSLSLSPMVNIQPPSGVLLNVQYEWSNGAIEPTWNSCGDWRGFKRSITLGA